jgi:hypothetical protein
VDCEEGSVGGHGLDGLPLNTAFDYGTESACRGRRHRFEAHFGEGRFRSGGGDEWDRNEGEHGPLKRNRLWGNEVEQAH